MEWRYSDGTVVTLEDGRDVAVAGDGPFATDLRRQLRLPLDGFRILVSVRPEPGGTDPLDPRDPWSVHCWLHERLNRVDGVVEVSAPTVSAPESPASLPGVIY